MAGQEHKRYVLDSYALLAFFEGEQGQEVVAGLLKKATRGSLELYLSVINLGEIAYIVERERGLPQAQVTLAHIGEFPVSVIDVDRRLALSAAHLKAGHTLAYADCFAAALAQSREAALVTGDPEFKKAGVDSLVPVVWLD